MSSDAILRDISDTALGVAVERARETERKRPLFRDPYAEMLAGERGQRIARETRHRLISSGVVVRTAVFDELILQAVNRDRAACVLNLGAGLDTRGPTGSTCRQICAGWKRTCQASWTTRRSCLSGSGRAVDWSG